MHAPPFAKGRPISRVSQVAGASRIANTILITLFALIGSLAVAGCSTRTNASDDAGKAIVHDTSRIVVLGGALAETTFALGLGDHVVATDISAKYPPEVQERATLGYFRTASAEGIIAQNPTLVLATVDTRPATALDQLRAAGIDVVLVPEPQTWEGAEERIAFVGATLGVPDRAQSVIESMRRDLAEAHEIRPSKPSRALFVYARGLGTVYVSGTGTAADFVMREAGALNAVTQFADFQQITPEAIVEAAPDVIVIPERGLESIGGPDGLFGLPGIAQTPAAKARRVVAIEDALLVGMGPRTGEAITQLARALGSVES